MILELFKFEGLVTNISVTRTSASGGGGLLQIPSDGDDRSIF